MASNPVGWFETYVQGMTRAKKFYEPVLQANAAKPHQQRAWRLRLLSYCCGSL